MLNFSNVRDFHLWVRRSSASLPLTCNLAKTGAYLQMREGESSAAILIALWIGPIMPLTGPEVGANGWRPHLHSISLIEQQA